MTHDNSVPHDPGLELVTVLRPNVRRVFPSTLYYENNYLLVTVCIARDYTK